MTLARVPCPPKPPFFPVFLSCCAPFRVSPAKYLLLYLACESSLLSTAAKEETVQILHIGFGQQERSHSAITAVMVCLHHIQTHFCSLGAMEGGGEGEDGKGERGRRGF